MKRAGELQVVILCGGLGTRMGASSGRLPKPMVEVGGRPLLWHIMRGYAAFGCRRFVLCLGHRGDVIRSWFLHGRHIEGDLTLSPGGEVERDGEDSAADWQITLAETGHLTPTGGRLLRARPHLDPDAPFFMTYGDGVADVDLDALLAHHRELARTATVTAMRARSRFGTLQLEAGRVHRFEEKPLLRERVSGGFFVFEPAIFDALVDDEALEQGALGRLAAADALAGYLHDGFWMSVDTPRDLAALEAMWTEGKRPWL